MNQSTLKVINSETIAQLKKEALAAPNFRTRICLHESLESQIQEMVIAFHARSFIGPHRQQAREKSYILLDGEALVAFFDDQGKIEEQIVLKDVKQDGNSVIRFPSSRWHIFVPQTEYVVYIEILQGPFTPDLTEYPAWAPAIWNAEVIRNFLHSYKIPFAYSE